MGYVCILSSWRYTPLWWNVMLVTRITYFKSNLRNFSRWIHSDLTFGASKYPCSVMRELLDVSSGNHETPGTFRMAGFEDDLEDLRAVVAFLTSQLGYSIDMLVGHSRGSIVAFKWICTAPEGASLSAFVNVSGRYRMEVSLTIRIPPSCLGVT